MRMIKAYILLTVLSMPCFADSQAPYQSDGYDVAANTLLIPFGIAATIASSAVYVGISPLTALATIPPPHDAFQKLADVMICKPFKWTFIRRAGDYTYNEGC
jgi:hypothetical protein